MASLIRSNCERDLEQGLVEEGFEVLEIDKRKRELVLAEHSNAIIALEKFSCYTMIISIIFIIFLTRVLMDFEKRAPTAFTVFLMAGFASILVGMVSKFGRALRTRRIGPALPIKRILFIGYVLLCISEGFFMVSVFAAAYMFQLSWFAIGMGLLILVVQIALLAVLHSMGELRAGFEGMLLFTFLALAFRLSGLAVVVIESMEEHFRRG